MPTSDVVDILLGTCIAPPAVIKKVTIKAAGEEVDQAMIKNMKRPAEFNPFQRQQHLAAAGPCRPCARADAQRYVDQLSMFIDLADTQSMNTSTYQTPPWHHHNHPPGKKKRKNHDPDVKALFEKLLDRNISRTTNVAELLQHVHSACGGEGHLGNTILYGVDYTTKRSWIQRYLKRREEVQAAEAAGLKPPDGAKRGPKPVFPEEVGSCAMYVLSESSRCFQ